MSLLFSVSFSLKENFKKRITRGEPKLTSSENPIKGNESGATIKNKLTTEKCLGPGGVRTEILKHFKEDLRQICSKKLKYDEHSQSHS